MTKVEEIAGPFERIRRCQVTGETLLGGYVAGHITRVMW